MKSSFARLILIGLLGGGLAAAQGTATSSSPPATVTCKDGTSSKGGRGACSGHGGINKSAATTTAPAASAPAASTPAPAAPPAAAPSTPAKTSAAKTSTAAASTAKSGSSVNTDPTGAIAKCKDGTYSHAKTHTGACSHHGGVANFLDGK